MKSGIERVVYICCCCCCCRSKLEETRLRQKIREKPKGISIAELAIGKKITLEEEVTAVSGHPETIGARKL